MNDVEVQYGRRTFTPSFITPSLLQESVASLDIGYPRNRLKSVINKLRYCSDQNSQIIGSRCGFEIKCTALSGKNDSSDAVEELFMYDKIFAFRRKNNNFKVQ